MDVQLESGGSAAEAVGVHATQRQERLEQVALAAGDQEGRLKQAIADVKQLVQRLQTNLRALQAAVAQLEQAHDTVEQWGGDARPEAQQQATELLELRERYEDLESRYDKLVAMQERKEASGGEQVKCGFYSLSPEHAIARLIPYCLVHRHPKYILSAALRL